MARITLLAGWTGKVLVAATALAFLATAAQASPIMIYEVGLADGSKAVEVKSNSQVVTVNLYAYVRNMDTSTTNDRVFFATGSIVSSNGGLLGDLAFWPSAVPSWDPDTYGDWPYGAPNVGLFHPLAYKDIVPWPGTRQDMDGDGDLDLGQTGPGSAEYFYINNGTVGLSTGVAGQGKVTVPGFGTDTYKKIALATGIEFTVNDLSLIFGESTVLSFVPRADTTLANQAQSDNISYNLDANNPAQLGNAGGVTVTFVPEPATMALLGLGFVGLLVRRRRAA